METFVFMKAISRISLNKDNLFGAQKQKIKDNPLLHLNCKETEIFVFMTLSKTVHFLMTVLEKDNSPIDLKSKMTETWSNMMQVILLSGLLIQIFEEKKKKNNYFYLFIFKIIFSQNFYFLFRAKKEK
jgi:hypothetical protein